MALTYTYEVSEKPLGDGTHTYEAKDESTGDVICLPRGGNDDGQMNLVGSYPEIEAHLKDKHGVQTQLEFNPRFDEMSYRPGGATWTYQREGGQLTVIVKDTHRTVFRITINWSQK